MFAKSKVKCHTRRTQINGFKTKTFAWRFVHLPKKTTNKQNKYASHTENACIIEIMWAHSVCVFPTHTAYFVKPNHYRDQYLSASSNDYIRLSWLSTRSDNYEIDADTFNSYLSIFVCLISRLRSHSLIQWHTSIHSISNSSTI